MFLTGTHEVTQRSIGKHKKIMEIKIDTQFGTARVRYLYRTVRTVMMR